MDILDVVILVTAVAAAVHGTRVGAIAQLIAFVGFVAGLAIGVALVLAIAPHVHGEIAKTCVALGLLVVPSIAVGTSARRIGRRSSRAIVRIPLRRLNQVSGSVVAVAGTLAVYWLFASITINSELGTLANQIERSKIIQGTETVLPPVPNEFAAVERYLTDDGFPQVLVNVLPESVAPVTLPDRQELEAGVAAAAASTVKIVALGCGDEQEGSGFIAAREPGADLVVTNAHVVAGTGSISVVPRVGAPVAAVPVLFDQRFDLAVLRVPVLSGRVLEIDPGVVERGTGAVVLGYPGGGPFTPRAAGVLARFAAEGRDIYDNALTIRTVYELRAVVRPGDSGGPLITPAGEVLGVVFSRSASDSDVGYALASPGVLVRVGLARHDHHAVSTGSCIDE